MKKSIYSSKTKQLLELLIKARNDAGFTQQTLATKIDKHQSFIAKYEGGERRLDVVEFIEICQAIGVDPDKIIKKLV